MICGISPQGFMNYKILVVYSMMGKWTELCAEEVSIVLHCACEVCMWVIGVETMYKASGCVIIHPLS